MKKNQTQDVSSPIRQAGEWIVVFVAGLGILWVVEVLLNLIVDWGLNWRLDGWGYLLLFFGSGILVLVAMILAARLAAHTTARFAPRPRKGLVILGVIYVVAQAVRLYLLLGEPESIWQNVLMKVEFAIVVSIVFVLEYRAEDPEEAAELQAEGGAAQ